MGCVCLQALISNEGNLPLESLLNSCRNDQGPDPKVLFMRAATAAGLMQNQTELWYCIKAAVEGRDQRCKPAHLTVSPMCHCCLSLH